MVDQDDEIGTPLPSKLDEGRWLFGAEEPIAAARSYGTVSGLLHSNAKTSCPMQQHYHGGSRPAAVGLGLRLIGAPTYEGGPVFQVSD